MHKIIYKSSFFRFCLSAASFSGMFFSAMASMESAVSPIKNATEDIDLEFDESKYSVKDKKNIFSGNIHLSTNGFFLKTDEVIFDPTTKEIEVTTPAEITYIDSRILIEKGHYDGTLQYFYANEFRMKMIDFVMRGDEIKIGENAQLFLEGNAPDNNDKSKKIFVSDVEFYYGEPHWSSISFGTSSIVYDSDSDYFHLDTAIGRVAGLPVFVLPPVSVPRFDRPPVRVWLNAGADSTAGYYFRNTTYLTVFKDVEPGVVLDFYERSGLLVGPALAYENLNISENITMSGQLYSGYINDSASRQNDIYGESTTGKRGFIEWTHKQNISNLEISSAIHYRSDSEVLRDFRPNEYEKNQNPESYVEVVYPDADFYVSVWTKLHLNEYQNVQQRLPELRFDLTPKELGDTEIYQHFYASYALLREEDSQQYHIYNPNKDNYLESSRFDTYYGLSRSFKYSDFLSFTPVVGVRATYYGNTANDIDDTYFRALGQFGFDLKGTISGVSDFENKTWGIKGLRHILQPVVQYRYIPNADKGIGKIPQIDRECIFFSPPSIDLNKTRSGDELYDSHVMRIGLENLWQTRDVDYGSRDLVEFNLYQDIRDTSRPNDRHLADTYFQLNMIPAEWIQGTILYSIDPYSFDTRYWTAGIQIKDGDAWRISLGLNYQYWDREDLRYIEESNTRQIFGGIEYKINSQYSVGAAWRFDDRLNLLTEQNYSLYQRLGSNWILRYYFSYRENSRDEDNYNLGFSASLQLF